ncbi:MAG TPA: universal stress protein [Ilumatobacteraceae bacterium]|nr:universal stress protein [Ilumatobacteraceae bacterium]
MTMRIVVGVDGSKPSFEALRWAVHEARRRDAEVRVISCYQVPAYGGPDGAMYPISIDLKTLEGAATAVVGRAIEVATQIDPQVIVDGATPLAPPVPGIMESVAAGDEIVVGATGHSGLIAGLLGSVAAGVVHRAHVPVVVVPASSATEFGRTLKKIVLGVDGSPESLVALDWAYDEALVSGAELTVVHAWIYPYSLSRSSSREALSPMEFDAAKELQDSLDSLGQRSAGGSVVIHSKLREESAVAALLNEGHDADLIVVGSRGRGGFRSRLLGSVSRTLAEHATCPVAVIRRAES